MAKPSLDEIFGNTNISQRERPSLDDVFAQSSSNANINPTGRTSSPQDFLAQELSAQSAAPKPMGFGFNAKQYFQEAQPAFKLALEHPETLMGQAISPDQINQTTGGDYADIYRRAALPLPGTQSTNIGGQLIPQAAGLALDVASRPSAYLTAPIINSLNKTPVGQAINKFLTKQRGFLNFGGEKTAQKIAEKADQGIDKVGDYMSSKYDDFFNELKTSKGTATPDKILSSIDDVTAAYPTEEAGKLAQIKTRLLDIQKKNGSLTAEELLNLKQEVRKLVPKSVWQGKIDPDALQSAKQDIYFKINDELGGLGGEKYKALSKEYRTFRESQRLVKKIFYNQGVPSNAKMGGSIDMPQKEALRSLNSQLPPKEQFLSEFEAWRRGQAVKKAAPWVAGGGAGTVIADRILNGKQ